jgi:hypothetical protein
MKGYTEVTVEKALLALETRNKRKDIAVALRDEAIERYATNWKRKANFYQKWSKRKYDTAAKLIYSNHDWWANISLVLRPFIDNEEDYQRVVDHERASYYKEGPIIRNLVNASTSGILLLDNELCEFINKFTMPEEVEDES